jgi:hypothetical protein
MFYTIYHTFASPAARGGKRVEAKITEFKTVAVFYEKM